MSAVSSRNAEAWVRSDEPAPYVLRLTLDRPDKLNALSLAMLQELAGSLERAAADPGVRCVILTGAGRAFCVGADLAEFIERGASAFQDPRRLAAWEAVDSFSKPMIAAINGHALGGGLELAMLCDILLANRKARLGTPEINVASFPGDGGTQRLPRLVGRSFSMQMILTGETIDASLAERKGMLSEVVAADRLQARCVEIARLIAGKSADITPYAKRSVRAADRTCLHEGLRIERELVVEAFASPDREEGLRAFAEKRAPVFNRG